MNDKAEQTKIGLSKLRQNFSLENVSRVARDQFSKTEETRPSSRFRILWTVFEMIKQSRNPWYYWYTGKKIVAVQAWCFAFGVMFGLAVLGTGGSVVKALIYVLIGIALHNFVVVAIALVWLIDYFIFPIPLGLYQYLITPVLISALISFFVIRLAVFIVTHSKET